MARLVVGKAQMKELIKLKKLGLFSLRSFATAVEAAKKPVQVEYVEPKQSDWLDDWGKWHTPAKKIDTWPADFKEYPERDLVNFPHPVQKMYEGKVRLGFIPDEWFQAFYKKTGVTGPYLFGWGLVAFLLQKEFWVIEHEFKHLPPLLILIFITYKLYGAKIHKYCDQQLQAEVDDEKKDIINVVKEIKESVQLEKAHQEMLPDCIANIAEAKKENVDLQLELHYRERLSNAFQEVKRRVEYLAQSEEAKRRFEQKHMVNWIIDQVKKSITPQQEQNVLKQCISDLKRLAV